MYHNDRGSIAPDSIPEDFTHAHLRRVQGAAINCPNFLHPVAGIQQNHTQFLLLQAAHLILHQGRGISRAVDCGPFLGRINRQAAAQLDAPL